MAYVISLTRRAERDLAHLYNEIDAEHSDAALKWYHRLKESILSLEEGPNRCPVTPESARFYRVLEKQKLVEVLHIRHGARREFTGADVE